MLKIMKKILILGCILGMTLPLYAQEELIKTESTVLPLETVIPETETIEEAAEVAPVNNDIIAAFLEFINRTAHAALNGDDEKKVLRQKWKELLKIDVFYPYFKVKEVEDLISDKVSVKAFSMSGRPKLEKNRIKYIFKKRF